MMQALNQYQNERRDIEFSRSVRRRLAILLLRPRTALKLFDERKVLFRAPEYRKVTLLPLSPAELAKPGDITTPTRRLITIKTKRHSARPKSANCGRSHSE